MSSLGDVLLATPLIRLLRKKFPQSQIDFLVRTEYSDLLRYNPNLSNIIEFDVRGGFAGLRKLRESIRKNKYNIILDIHKNLRSIYLRFDLNRFSKRHQKVLIMKKDQIIRFLLVKWKINLYRRHGRIIAVWEKYIRAAKSLKINHDNAGLELFLPDSDETKIESFFKKLPIGNWQLVVAPGARHFTKRWLAEYFAEVINGINQKYGLNTILVGGQDDIAVIDKILASLPSGIAVSSAGGFSIMQTAAIIKRSSLFVCNDSGLMHVAAAFKKPTIAIFGSSVEELGFFPYNPNAVVLEQKNLPCRPCSHIGRSKCPKKHFKCMRDILPKQVMSVIKEKSFLKKGS